MILTHIMLTNMEAVNEFVRLTNAAEYKDLRINLLCENSEVDAKSIMNVFSTDLSRPILLSADGEDEDAAVAGLLDLVNNNFGE